MIYLLMDAKGTNFMHNCYSSCFFMRNFTCESNLVFFVMQTLYYFKLFEKELLAVSTTRTGGVSKGAYAMMNLCRSVGDDPENVEVNRQLFCRSLDMDPEKLIFPRQTHGDRIATIDDAFFRQSETMREKALIGVDALVTSLKGVCIGVSTADCVPLLFYDPRRKVAGAAHAGWRGTIAAIAPLTLRRMWDDFGCRASDIHITIAPCISAENYVVGQDLYDTFSDRLFPVNKLFTKNLSCNKWHLDLRETNRWLLIDAGVDPEHITTVSHCTFGESDRFFSARKLGVCSGRIASCIMVRKQE